MALKEGAVEGLTTGQGSPDVSINLIGSPPGPGCSTAYSDALEETKCSKNKAESKLVLTGAKVGRYCAAIGVTVNEVTHVKATFSTTSQKMKVEGNAPLRKDDIASGGSCSCTLISSPYTPYAATFTGSIDNAGQTKVKAE